MVGPPRQAPGLSRDGGVLGGGGALRATGASAQSQLVKRAPQHTNEVESQVASSGGSCPSARTSEGRRSRVLAGGNRTMEELAIWGEETQKIAMDWAGEEPRAQVPGPDHCEEAGR